MIFQPVLRLVANVVQFAFPPQIRPELRPACITIRRGSGDERVVLKGRRP